MANTKNRTDKATTKTEKSVQQPDRNITGRESILTLVCTSKGVDFQHYKAGTVDRRINRRMTLLGLNSSNDYLLYLKEHPAEVDQLYEDLLIKVTSFFRDPDVFEVLKQTVFPAIAKSKAPLGLWRIWVPGCATGEEVYSIAIALTDYFCDVGDSRQAQIFATDISQIAIAKARAGIYSTQAVEKISPERLARYFIKDGDTYQVNKTLRKMCVFAEQNVTKDPPFSNLDLISCQNLLIYLDPHLQRRVMATFHFALEASGFLMLGGAEGSRAELFSALDNNTRVFARRSVPGRVPDFAAGYIAEKCNYLPAEHAASDTSSDNTLKTDADRTLVAKCGFNGVVVDSNMTILQFRGNTRHFLEHKADEMTSCNLFKMARKELIVDLRLAIHEASATDSPVRQVGLKIVTDKGPVISTSIEVIPYRSTSNGQRHFIVLFSQEKDSLENGGQGHSKHASASAGKSDTIGLLRRELAETKEYLNSLIEKEQAANEELKSASEEILSSNEELRTTNEELQTAKEESHAINEELATVNDELRARNIEVSQTNSDMSNIFTSTQIPILMLTADLTCRVATPVSQKALGLSRSPVGAPISLLLQNFDIPDLEKLISSVIETLIPIEREVTDHDGRWYAMRIRPYRTIANKIDGAVLSLSDISFLKETIARLEETREYSQAIVETTPVPLIVLDGDLRVVLANQSFHEFFQLESDQIRERLIYRIGNGEWDIPELRKLLERVLPQEEKLRDFAVKRVFPRLGLRSMKLNATRLLQLAAKRELILLTFRDITEESVAAEKIKIAKDGADTANQAKSDFLANMSHEIRTPLAAILGFTELLESRETSPQQNAPLEKIRRNVQNLTELIDEILDLSKVEAGKLEINLIKFELLSEISEAIGLLRTKAELKKVAFDISFIGAIPETILSCPMRLRQILMNIIGNAVKFTAKGSVNVAVELTRDELLTFRVSDSGCGLTEAQQLQIFRPFGQADSSVTRKYGGTGLGLNLSRKLAEALGGNVILAKSEEGKGSTFTITVGCGPLAGVRRLDGVTQADLLARPTGAMEPFRINDRLGGMQILLVEDSEDNQILLSTFLRMSGAQVTLADNGERGLHMALGGEFDLVFMDVQMPVMDGYEASRRLKEASYDSPVVALTAHAMSGEREKCIAAGYVDYVAKPVSARALTAMAEKYGIKKKGASTETSVTATATDSSEEAAREGHEPDADALMSTLADDPQLIEIINNFVKKLPDRIASLRRALAGSNLKQVRNVAHQMSGAAGGYGYPDITEICREIELRAKGRESGANRELTQLIGSCGVLCDRAALGRTIFH